MIALTLKPTRAAKKEFDFVDFEVLSQCATALVNNINFDNLDRKYTLKIDVSKYPTTNPCSHYLWKKNAICIHPLKRYEKPYKLRRFIGFVVHELKHWTQDKLLKVSFNKNYKDQGMEYYNCPIEQDTRKYTDLVLNAAIKNYNSLLQIKQQSLEYKALGITFY